MQYRSAIPKSRQQRHEPRRGVLTHSFFSYTGCCIRSSFHIFRNQDEQLVWCHFVVVFAIVFFCAIKFRINIISCHKWVLVLTTRLPSLVSSIDPTCSHARITPSSMLGMPRCYMVFDFKFGRSTSDYSNIGSLKFNRLIIDAFIHNLVLDMHDLQLGFWRLRRRAAVSPTHLPPALHPSRVPKAFRMYRAQLLIASCAPLLRDFGVHQVHWQSPF